MEFHIVSLMKKTRDLELFIRRSSIPTLQKEVMPLPQTVHRIAMSTFRDNERENAGLTPVRTSVG
jgi:hypothetical protein